jgi:hypothetical protein
VRYANAAGTERVVSIVGAARRCRRAPHHLPGCRVKRVESASFLRVQHQPVTPGQFRVRDRAQSEIGDRNINLAAIRSRAPLAASEWPAVPHARLPEYFAFSVRVERAFCFVGFSSSTASSRLKMKLPAGERLARDHFKSLNRVCSCKREHASKFWLTEKARGVDGLPSGGWIRTAEL